MDQSDFKPKLMATETLFLNFTSQSPWLEIQSAFTAKGEGRVPPEEIQVLVGFCFFWEKAEADEALHLDA